jgi:hypothetical protein
MLNFISKKHPYRTFSVSAENKTGEKGKGGMSTDGTAAACARDLGQGWKVDPYINVAAGQTCTLADIKGQGAIKHIWLTASIPSTRDLIFRIYWDGNEQPSVETPLGDFFASANQQEHHQVSSLAVCVNSRNALNCYWEMPYRKGFRITVENISPQDAVLYYQIDCEEKEIGEDALYFHAQFRRMNPLPYKEVYTIVDGIKGNGQYVGTYMYWGTNNNGWWGEGEIKFYMDGDTDFPTICGTGTEDYFCGAWCFRAKGNIEDSYYINFTSPYSGFDANTTNQFYNSQKRFNLYRWHIQDPIYFKNDLKVTIQALGWRNERRYLPLQDDISSVAFWYSDNLDDVYPTLPDRDYLEII